MPKYFNYHATAKRLIQEGKLRAYYFTHRHNQISPFLAIFLPCDKMYCIEAPAFDRPLLLLSRHFSRRYIPSPSLEDIR